MILMRIVVHDPINFFIQEPTSDWFGFQQVSVKFLLNSKTQRNKTKTFLC